MDTRTLVAAFVDRLERRDWPGFAELIDPDVVYEMPQSRERIRGRDRYVIFNQEYPGDWHLDPQVIIGDDEHGVVWFRWITDLDQSRDGDHSAGQNEFGIAFFDVADGRITKITDFWPEPFDPLPGREHLTERW